MFSLKNKKNKVIFEMSTIACLTSSSALIAKSVKHWLAYSALGTGFGSRLGHIINYCTKLLYLILPSPQNNLYTDTPCALVDCPFF